MWNRLCTIFLIIGLASADDPPTSKDAKIGALTYQNTQTATAPNAPPPENINQGNIAAPQPLFNPQIYQNAQPNFNPIPQFLPTNGDGFGNIQLGAFNGGFGFNDGGFGGFNPVFGGNNFQIPPGQNLAPQEIQSAFGKEIRVPQPYPVYVSKPVPVQVPVRIPVEVPKPYPIRIPHPVPVPVEVKVPVPVEKPYPVTITRTVPVPVEKPVYIRVPQLVPEHLAQAYPNIQGGFQQGGNLGQIPGLGQPVPGYPQEIQIGGRIQSNPQQLNGQQVQSVGPTDRPVSGQSPLLSGEGQGGGFSSATDAKALQTNEVQSDREVRQ